MGNIPFSAYPNPPTHPPTQTSTPLATFQRWPARDKFQVGLYVFASLHRSFKKRKEKIKKQTNKQTKTKTYPIIALAIHDYIRLNRINLYSKFDRKCGKTPII